MKYQSAIRKQLLIALLSFFTFQVIAQRKLTLSKGVEDISISPGGDQIAASIFGKIWLIPLEGGSAKQLTFGFGWDSFPAWSEDGLFLAYSHQSPQGSSLLVYNTQTGNIRDVYSAQTHFIGQIQFHSGKKKIFFLGDAGQYTSHLWSVPIQGGTATQHTFGKSRHEWSFALSKSGDEVLLPQGKYGVSDLYMKSIEKDSVVRLTRTELIDERDVAWNQTNDTYVFVERENGVDHISIREANGSSKRISSSPYSKKKISIHPNGKFAVLLDQRQLFRLDLTTGKRSPISFKVEFNLPERAKPELVVRNVNVFDAVGETLQKDMMVEIRGGRISAILKDSDVDFKGLKVIDGQGKTLIPGLMDNHFHFWHYMTFWGNSFILPKGVTSIRDVGAEISQSMNLKEAMAHGILDGPTIYTTGPLIDGEQGYHPMVDVPMTDPNAVEPLVKSLKAQGADALKAYFMLDSAMMKPLADAARKHNLPLTGHIGVKIGWRAAAEAGINGFSHIRIWRDMLPLEDQPNGNDESLESGVYPVQRMQADWSKIDMSDPKIASLLDFLAENNVAMDPTVGIQQVGNNVKENTDFEQYYDAKLSFEKAKQFVKMAYDRGVLILAGTDSGNLHSEMQHYSDAGIPNHAVIKSATINGAKWLGRENEFGTIEVGKRADLVLIDGNPLENMKDIEKVSLVIKEGRIVFKLD